jgi:hypothetical protein
MQIAKAGVFDVRMVQVRTEAEFSVANHVESAAKLVPIRASAQELMLLPTGIYAISNLTLKRLDRHSKRGFNPLSAAQSQHATVARTRWKPSLPAVLPATL